MNLQTANYDSEVGAAFRTYGLVYTLTIKISYFHTHIQKYKPFAYNLTEKSKRYKNILLEREVIADFCYQTGPLTQLKEVR